MPDQLLLDDYKTFLIIYPILKSPIILTLGSTEAKRKSKKFDPEKTRHGAVVRTVPTSVVLILCGEFKDN
jgi:hypothetical protein